MDLPEGFCYVQDEIPGIHRELRYWTSENFIGRPIDGYERPVPILTCAATYALSDVESELNKQGLGLLIYDGYRPQRAVDHFVRWARDTRDTLQKNAYYPAVPKSKLFEQGYISSRSGHTRGSTVDLTIIELDTEEPLDMGGPYDFFGELSHHSYPHITDAQKANRTLLKSTMSKHGFRPYSKEWWHYTLRGEPFADQYFDFVVE